jgi:hypothetical protein
MSKLLSLYDQVLILEKDYPELEVCAKGTSSHETVEVKRNGVLSKICKRKTNLYLYTPEKGNITKYSSLKELLDALMLNSS